MGNRESGCPFLISSRGDGAAEPRASGASALGRESERSGEVICKATVKKIGRGEYHRDRIGGEERSYEAVDPPRYEKNAKFGEISVKFY